MGEQGAKERDFSSAYFCAVEPLYPRSSTLVEEDIGVIVIGSNTAWGFQTVKEAQLVNVAKYVKGASFVIPSPISIAVICGPYS